MKNKIVEYKEMLEAADDILKKPRYFLELKNMVLRFYPDIVRERKFKIWMDSQKVYKWPFFLHEEEYWLAFYMCVEFKKVWNNDSNEWITFDKLDPDEKRNMEFCSGFLLF